MPYCLNKKDIRPENPVNKPFTRFSLQKNLLWQSGQSRFSV